MKIKDENIISNYATNDLINEVINAIKNSDVQVNSIKTSDSFLESAADISFKIPSLDRSTASNITFKLKKAFERKGFRTPKFMNSNLPTGYNFTFRGKDILRGVVFVNIERKDCTVYVTSKSKLRKDSKLYKVGDKIVKASSVNDAINKVKDFSTTDIISILNRMETKLVLISKKEIKSKDGTNTILKYKTPYSTKMDRLMKKNILAELKRAGFSNGYSYDLEKNSTKVDISVENGIAILDIIDNNLKEDSSTRDNNNCCYRGYEIIDNRYESIVYSEGKTNDASKKAKRVSIPFILNIAKDYARVIGNGLNNKTIEGFKLTLASKKIDTEEGKEDIDVNKGYITLIFRYQFTGSGRYDPSDLPDDVMKYMNTNRSLFSTYMGSLHTRYTLRYNASAKTLTIMVLLY